MRSAWGRPAFRFAFIANAIPAAMVSELCMVIVSLAEVVKFTRLSR